MPQQPGLEIYAASQPPTPAEVFRTLHVEVPTDPKSDPILLCAREALVQAPYEEIMPDLSPALKIKLRLFLEAQIGYVAADLRRAVTDQLKKP